MAAKSQQVDAAASICSAFSGEESGKNCVICGHRESDARLFKIRSNVRRFRHEKFDVWRCSDCKSIHCQPVDDLAKYYENYFLRRQTLNPVTRSWYGVLLKWLRQVGFNKSWSLLDYGCGDGMFLDYLTKHRFSKCKGYDPYVEKFQDPHVLNDSYDLVFSQDVIEHDDHPAEFLSRLSSLVRQGGYVSIGTPNADGIDLTAPEEDIHQLHMPYHRHILSSGALMDIASRCGLTPVAAHYRFFRNHWFPAANRRFIFELIRCQGNDIDATFDPVAWRLFLRHPKLLWYLFFGYFLPDQKRDHMHVIFRKG